MLKNNHFYFWVILVLSFLVRITTLGSIPASLNWDEVSHGYNAYSLAETGLDQWGTPWPITNFRAYGDYPTTLNLYLTIPSIKLFGLNPFAIRLPSAIFNVATLVAIYFIGRYFFPHPSLAIITMFIAAISPWLFFPSRGVFQSNLSLPLYSFGLLFFFLSLKKPRLFIGSALLFSASLYAYHNTRIVAPVTLIFLFIVYRKHLLQHLKHYLLPSILFLLVSLPIAFSLTSPEINARNRWVGIINPQAINLINQQRLNFTGPPIVNRLLHNRYSYFLKTVSTNYLNLINPIPLFFQGSQNYQFGIPHTPLIFSIFLPFFYLGIIRSLMPQHTSLRILAPLFVISLIPAAITTGDFPSIRASLALPFYFLYIVAGIHSTLRIIPKLSISILLFCSLLQFSYYLHQYFVDYPRHYSLTWQYGYEAMVKYLQPIYSQYDHIYITKKYGEPHEFVLFYWPWKPRLFLNDNNLSYNQHDDWFWVDSFDKFRFVNDWDISHLQFPPSTLLVSSPGNTPSTLKSLHTINTPDDQPIFEISDNL